MLVRIRSRDGNFRFELQPTSDISELVSKILDTAPDADPATLTISNQPRGNEILVSTLKNRDMQGLGFKHGDLLFVNYQPRATPSNPVVAPEASSADGDTSTTKAARPWESVPEDTVDVYWRSQEGKIPRNRDAQFCKHGANAMCDHCMPLEPYDAEYHAANNIKLLSYHAYLRKITPKTSSASTSSLAPLNPLSYKVKIPCPAGHPPWPAAICSSCQPSAITLQRQPFRMVDHLEVASFEIIDRFLGAWRKTGLQRFGWLIGHYEPYDKVPMGVKAVVEAIHEPPQEGELDGLTLGVPWEDEPRIRALARSASTPLQVVGYVFTDLDPMPEDKTRNVYKRHPQSFFVSSLEAIFAAQVQLANPTPSRSSSTGVFSSRMVTAVLTATEEGAIDVSAYQVSEQACAMVEADMIEASVDPGIVRVKEEDRSQDHARYIPDVFYRYKNDYGLEVKKSAKPCFPIEYLLVTLTYGIPQNSAPLFRSDEFQIENRMGLEDQSIEQVMRRLAALGAPDLQESRFGGDHSWRATLARYLSDWHLVTFLGTTQLISEDDMNILIRVATSSQLDDPAVLDPLITSDSWQTLMTFTRESAPSEAPGRTVGNSSGVMDMDEDIPAELLEQIRAADAAGGSASSNIRICPHCTFENTHGGTDCEVCGLPLG